MTVDDSELAKRHKEIYDSTRKAIDNINPIHYKIGGIETWDYLKAKLSPSQLAGFALGNVSKYVARTNHKDKLESLKKAKWYLDKLIEEIEKSQDKEGYFK